MTKFRYEIRVEEQKQEQEQQPPEPGQQGQSQPREDQRHPHKILSIQIFGSLERESFMQMISEAREQAHRENLNLLYDMRNMSLPENISFKELFAFASTHPMLNRQCATELRSASLLSQQLLAEDIWDLYQYASQNVGLQWMFFVDRGQALDWLNS